MPGPASRSITGARADRPDRACWSCSCCWGCGRSGGCTIAGRGRSAGRAADPAARASGCSISSRPPAARRPRDGPRGLRQRGRGARPDRAAQPGPRPGKHRYLRLGQRRRPTSRASTSTTSLVEQKLCGPVGCTGTAFVSNPSYDPDLIDYRVVETALNEQDKLGLPAPRWSPTPTSPGHSRGWRKCARTTWPGSRTTRRSSSR